MTNETPHAEIVRALIQHHLEDVAHNRLPIIQKKTGFDIDQDPRSDRSPPASESEAGRSSGPRTSPTSCPTPSSNATRRASTTSGWSTTGRPNVHIPRHVIEMVRDAQCEPKRPRVLQAKDSIRPVADRGHRAAPQHARKSDAGDHPPSERVSRQRPGVHRAAQDAANRRPGRRARDDREPGRGRQMGADAPRHLPAQALLRRRHAHRRAARKSPGKRSSTSCLELIDNEDKSNPLSDEDLVTKLQESGYPVARRTVTKYRKMLRHSLVAAAQGVDVWLGKPSGSVSRCDRALG